MDGEVIRLSYLMAIVIGWFLAKDKYSSLLAEEKDHHQTLAVQTLYLNGKGKISNQEFEAHDRVAKQVQELASADIGWLHSQVKIEIVDD